MNSFKRAIKKMQYDMVKNELIRTYKELDKYLYVCATVIANSAGFSLKANACGVDDPEVYLERDGLVIVYWSERLITDPRIREVKYAGSAIFVDGKLKKDLSKETMANTLDLFYPLLAACNREVEELQKLKRV